MLFAQIDAETVKKLLTEQNYTVAGVVLVILFFVGLAVWRVLSWTGTNVVIPARDRMFKHLDRVDSTMQDVSEMLPKFAEMPARLESIEGKVDDLNERVDDIDSHLQMGGNKTRRTSKPSE
jgi:hypothetical protein